MSDKIIIFAGTEVRTSEAGYYEYWYPSKVSHILEEDLMARRASTSEVKHTTTGEWMPVVVSDYVARTYGSPIRVLWVRKKIK